jgi:hypothetical protein
LRPIQTCRVLDDPPAFCLNLFLGPHPAGGGRSRQAWLRLRHGLPTRQPIKALTPSV